ncbi:MAG TPA: PfkB family carbohydrate kinase [Patescibacteria group bacterium]|nr:PfkB family carbohydrate kinase [Patescibacteria group bacterium]
MSAEHAEKPNVVGFGPVYVDILGYDVDFESLSPGKELIGGRYDLVIGGSAANFVRVINKMGIKSVFIGKTGDDDMGELMEKLAERESFPHEFLLTPGVQTSISENNSNSEGKVGMSIFGDASSTFTSDELMDGIEAYLGDAKILYAGGIFKLPNIVSTFDALASRAHEAEMKIVLDHGRIDHSKVKDETLSKVREIIPLVDYYLPSREEFCDLWGVKSIQEGLEKLAQIAPNTTVVVKDDKNGCATRKGGKIVVVEAFPVEKAAYQVGAGDTFNGAFISAIMKGLDTVSAMKYANAAGALKVSQPGVPTVEQIDDFIAKIR